MTVSENPMRLRLTLALIGALAGFFYWILFEYIEDMVADQRVVMLLASFAGILAGGLLVMVGRLGLRPAFRYASVFALVSAILLFWASFRFGTVGGFFNTMHPALAFSVLVWLPLPFAMAQETADSGWRDYEGLFDHAWSIFVRTITAWSFTGLVWLVVFLSDQLLSLVGFTYIGTLIEKLWIALPLTGAVLGLAMAVLNELKTVVSTLRKLALQLLRLLLPLVAVVVALFIILVPFQGLDRVFGALSAAATMLAMAAGAITLISSAIDARDSDAAQSRVMVLSAKALSVLLPVISAIAVYAIWLRIAQYGWTPPRISAAVIAVSVLAYSLAYAFAVLTGGAWRTRIRSANLWMALSLTALSALWFTPVLNVERISANSHVSRFESGLIKVSNLDLWRLGQDWGKAGQAALERVRAIKNHPEQAALADKLARYDRGESRWQYDNADGNQDGLRQLADLKALIPVQPKGSVIPEGALEELPRVTVGKILNSCKDDLPDGRPGCVMVTGTFGSGETRPAAVLFWRRDLGPGSEIVVLEQRQTGALFNYHRSAFSLGGDLEKRRAEELIALVLDGGFKFAPAKLNALEIDGVQILPRR